MPFHGVVPKAWREAVVDGRGRVERIPYELCVLVALRDALRRREVYVADAGKWRNPGDDLPADFETSRDVYYAELRQPLDLSEFIATCASAWALRWNGSVIRRWGTLDVLQDADFLTEFTTEFSSVASREVTERGMFRRLLLLCLFALGTNIGIRQLVDTGEHGETEAMLRHVRRHFITRDQWHQRYGGPGVMIYWHVDVRASR
ncbi:Tn3 family transposase [Saccharopolyspora spinosa]|uniref:Tn3 family transposase n=1 Tax=Saccharopolyspora spinosa TaxID=60894 RepID=UPI0005C9E725|nr:Tn3 family transposase [Saccharopolyspora spinosa]